MSYWNYRIIRKHHNKTGINTFHIHAVYSNDAHPIDGWTEKAVSPMGESLAELQRDIELFLKAFKKPILFEKKEKSKEILAEDIGNISSKTL